MDAGYSGYGKKEPNRARLRSQLLNNELGAIDVAEEEPMSGRSAPMYPGSPAFANNFAFQPQSQQQPAHGQFQPGRASQIPHSYPVADPRSSSLVSHSTNGKRSLQSNGLGNLFRMRHARSKDKDNEKDDDEGETYMTNGDNSILTFNDISSLRNNGGHKYGFGGAMDDTSPIIPTLITRGHDNMNNVEYRKHLAAQKKMAVSALAQQKQKSGNFPPGGPRTMSLQHAHNPYAAPGQQMGGQVPPYVRANSMMAGPPQQIRLPNARGTPPPPMAGGPRTMSLTTNRRPLVQPNAGFRPQMAGPQQGPHGPYMNGPQPMHQQNHRMRPNYPYNAGPHGENSKSASQLPRGNLTPLSTSSAISPNSPASLRPSTLTPDSNIAEGSQNADTSTLDPEQKSSRVSSLKSDVPVTGKLNVIKLSDPQQQELKNKEESLRALELQLREKENKLKEREQKAKELEKKQLEDLKVKQRADTDSPEAQQSPKFASNNQKPGNVKNQESNGKTSRRSQIQSVATFESSITNDSPVKRGSYTTGLYMLDNTTNGNAYFTASDLLNGGSSSQEPGNSSEVTITGPGKQASKTLENEGKSDGEPADISNKTTGLKKTKSFFKRFSSKGAKSDAPASHSRKSSSGSSFKRISSSDSLLTDKRSSLDERQIWNVQNEGAKRRSFHSLFSSSSLGPTTSESAKVPTPLTNIQEKNLTDQSLDKKEVTTNNLDQTSLSDSAKEESPESQGDQVTIARDLAYLNLHEKYKQDQDKASDDKDKASDDNDRASDDNNRASDDNEKASDDNDKASDDKFNFEAVTSEPYKPMYASRDELEPVLDSNHKFKTISISGTQMTVLTEQNTLMNEIVLLSKELAESIAREARLEQQISGKNSETEENDELCISDFELELRKKSSKVVELIQQLNSERLRRYIAEEQAMLHDNGVEPTKVDLVHKIHVLTKQLEEKDEEISKLYEKLGKADHSAL